MSGVGIGNWAPGWLWGNGSGDTGWCTSSRYPDMNGYTRNMKRESSGWAGRQRSKSGASLLGNHIPSVQWRMKNQILMSNQKNCNRIIICSLHSHFPNFCCMQVSKCPNIKNSTITISQPQQPIQIEPQNTRQARTTLTKTPHTLLPLRPGQVQKGDYLGSASLYRTTLSNHSQGVVHV